jgi:cell fate (sporulation/competence/biofilm development) regulator YlbF (YheA/YmcA/DUF963 family)
VATTDEILNAARALGQLLASHEAAAKFEATVRKLQDNADAQRILDDYNRHLAALSEKEASGKPIEVQDKRKLETLQQQVISHPLLQELQLVQMDYLDLMRRVDEAMSPVPPGPPGPSPAVKGPDIIV